MQLSYRAQIALLIANKVLIEFPKEYTKQTDVFFKKATVELPEHMKINNHSIDLKEYKQPLYKPIYSLELVEMESLKIYIKNNLKNGFIRFLKFPGATSILVIKKTDGFLQLYMYYQRLKNLMIKNCYLLLLINELLGCLR